MTDKVEHELIPEHEKLDEDRKEEILEKYNVEGKQMPKIKENDPAIQHLDVEEGDVIKITRESPTAGETTFYRSVIRD